MQELTSREELLKRLIDGAVELNLLNRAGRNMGDLAAMLDLTSLAAEFFTVHVDVGRAVGKTQFILQSAGAEDVVVVHSYDAKRHLRFRDCAAILASAAELNSPNNTYGIRWRGLRPPRRIFVDEPSLVEKLCPLNIIYRTFLDPALREPQVFILLGR